MAMGAIRGVAREAVLERRMSILSPILPDETAIAMAPRGFLRGTRIVTPRGLRPVEELRPGDMVCCSKGQPVIIRSVARSMVLQSGARVVCVSGEARGKDRQARPLLLPEGQMIVVAGDSLAAYFGVEEALAPVGALVNGQDLRLVEAPPADMWYELETAEPCTLVVDGLHVAVGDTARDSRPTLSAEEARLLSLAA
jgi:hypothetical protein